MDFYDDSDQPVAPLVVDNELWHLIYEESRITTIG